MPAALPKLPPGDDVVFRRLFDEENGCHLLVSLLNAILAYPAGRRIKTLSLLRSQVSGPLADDKEVILDIRAQAEDGSLFHVEVQVASHPCYSERILFYWAGMYAGQLEAGQGYGDLHAVVSVHILFFTLLKDPRQAAYHHVFRARADQDDAVLSPHLELHTVEMTKFPDLREGLDGEKWLYWLKHGHEMTEQEVERLGVPEILEAERKLAMISQDRQTRVDYERRRMAHHDAVSLRRDSWLEGKRQGIDEGKRQGIDEGKHTALVDALVAVLQARGYSLSPEQRARVEAEVDLTRLTGWIARAAMAASVEAVLNG
jgi:predicted transposase/invertase (TIGR01784 family)